MSKFRVWVSAARLRTLPLSVSGIIVGSTLGLKFVFDETIKIVESEFGGKLCLASISLFETPIFWLAILTTLGLQILSNFANDYGDGIKGTDNEDRIGPTRALQSGEISKKEMFRAIVITSVLTLIVAVTLIYVAFGKENFFYSIFFFVLGIIAIVSAIKYTMGSSAYGYKGLGDVFVFIFFGLVSVVGCYFLFAKNLNWLVFLPAITIGLLSTAVLNLNNMRDHNSDQKAGKNTLVVKLGIQKARMYHFTIIIAAIVSMLVFLYITYENLMNLLFLGAFVPLIIHLIKVAKTKNSELLDPELKKVALATFLLSILFSLGQIF